MLEQIKGNQPTTEFLYLGRTNKQTYNRRCNAPLTEGEQPSGGGWGSAPRAVTFIPMPVPNGVCGTCSYDKWVQYEVCRTCLGRGMGMNITAQVCFQPGGPGSYRDSFSASFSPTLSQPPVGAPESQECLQLWLAARLAKVAPSRRQAPVSCEGKTSFGFLAASGEEI